MFIVSGIFLGWGATLAPWGVPLCSRSPAESPEMISGRFVKLLGFTLKSSGSCIWCFGLLFSSLSSMRSRGLFFYWIMFLWGESMFELLGNIFNVVNLVLFTPSYAKRQSRAFWSSRGGHVWNCLLIFGSLWRPQPLNFNVFVYAFGRCVCLILGRPRAQGSERRARGALGT